MSLSLFPSPQRDYRPTSISPTVRSTGSRRRSIRTSYDAPRTSRPPGYSIPPTRQLRQQKQHQLLEPFSYGNDQLSQSPISMKPTQEDDFTYRASSTGQGSMDSKASAESPIQFQILLEGSDVSPVLLRQASNEVRRPRIPRSPKARVEKRTQMEYSKTLVPTLATIPASRSTSPSIFNPSPSYSPAPSFEDTSKQLKISTGLHQSGTVQLSPAALKLLACDIPTVNLLPSLDGSQYSDQHGISEAPPTPVVGLPSGNNNDWQLDPLPLDFAALRTLQILPNDYNAMSPIEFQEPISSTINDPPDLDRSPSGQASDEMQLEDVQSSLAETFYRRPWEDVVEIENFQKAWDFYSSVPGQQAPPVVQAPTFKARPWPHPFRQDSLAFRDDEESLSRQPEPSSQTSQSLPLAGLGIADRTSTWLKQQTNLLATLRTPSPQIDSIVPQSSLPTTASPCQSNSSSTNKKSVRFSNQVQTTVIEEQPIDRETIVIMRESAMYRAFQQLSKTSRRRDAFIQSIARSDSVHADRLTRRAGHINKLSSESPTYRKELPKAGASITKADAERFGQLDIEEAINQLNPSRWEVEASNYIHKKKLLISPSGVQLRKSPSKRLRSMDAATPSGKKQKPRILDLGGEACGWGWHCAGAFPNANVYTVIPSSPTTMSPTSASGSTPLSSAPKSRGPPNHRLVHVDKLYKLPFGESKFDVISARSLHQLLRQQSTALPVSPNPSADSPNAGTNVAIPLDEWDACVRECMRVLRPGGHLEFNILDAEITNPGSIGRYMNHGFARLARSTGFDTRPGKSFMERLGAAGFRGVRRCWMVLPAAQAIPEDADLALAAAESTDGNTRISSQLTGLVGARAWERWLLAMQRQDGTKEGRLLGDVGDFMEEAARVGSGFRYLTGYARKPRGSRGPKASTELPA